MQQHWIVSRTGSPDVRFRLQPPGTVRVGRSTPNSLVLPDTAVSREHALIEWTPTDDEHGAWRIIDRGSSSGTSVNGVPLRAYQSLGLEPGDRIDLGPIELEYVVHAGDEPANTVIADLDQLDTPGRVQPITPAALTAAQLEAVLASSEAIHLAANEEAVAQAAVEALARATGFDDVVFLRPVADFADIRVLASRGRNAERQRFSRSVLRRARTGPVVVSDVHDSGQNVTDTLVGLELSRVICVPVDLGEQFFGLIYLADSASGSAQVEAIAALARSIARVCALALSNIERTSMSARLEAEQREMFDGTLKALIAAIDAKDPYTRGHSARVAEYAYLLAKASGLDQAESERARLCGLVHDIGKIGVPESVLQKVDRLTEEEFRQIAAHPVVGHAILKQIPQMSDILAGVLEHHERWDGRGYPNGTGGEAISKLGRLLAVADSFDAMTTSRTYRPARPVAEAIEEITRCAETQFDPAFAQAFVALSISDLQRIVGMHVATGLPEVVAPEHAKPYTELLSS